MSFDTEVVGVMAAYLPVVSVCTAQSRETTSISVDMIETLLQF